MTAMDAPVLEPVDEQDPAAGATSAAGICLTFDDWFTRGWHGARDIFAKYDARATFFVAKPDKMHKRAFARLRELQKDGHEIGCHTLTHARLTKFLETNSVEDYIAQEIEPALHILREEGLKVTSFSYPYFKYRIRLTGLLMQHFNVIRAAGVQENFAHATYPDMGNMVVNVMGMLDRTGMGLGLDYYESRFDHLANQRGFGVFCGHAIGPDGPKNVSMHVSFEDLEDILAAAQARGLAMQTLRSIGPRGWML